MLDLAGIMISSILMFMVIMRAVQLDASIPWYKPPREGKDSSGLRLTPGAVAAPTQEEAPPLPKKPVWRR